MQFLPSAYEALRGYPQFIIYYTTPSKDRPGKTDKIPISYKTGLPHNPHDPAIWLSADAAISIVSQAGSTFGVGFVFTEHDPFFFLDIDNCWDDNTNSWNQLAINLCSTFNGAASEVSHSRRGLHIFGTSEEINHACKNQPLNLEFYTSERFVALTGNGATGNISTDFTSTVKWLVDTYFPPKIINTADTGNWTNEPCAEWNGPEDDTILINRALKSHSAKAVFGQGASFKDLWERNVEVLARAYPDNFSNREYDYSTADIALAQHLAFWTGNNCERILNLMQQSALTRDKYHREDYLRITVLNACAMQHTWLNDKPVQELPEVISAEGKLISGSLFLDTEGQLKLFKGCVYIRDQHKILIPGGDLLKPEQFRAHFGGYTFTLDKENQRTTRNAWEAFTESQVVQWPKAASSCFKPQLDPASITIEDGRALANIWWPITTTRIKGDPTPFLNHLKLILPDERDQLILLSYLAACVQFKGVKFQWAPLIQGVEGNGKTLFTRCAAFAMGYKYVFFPKADQIGKNFNKWMYQTLLIGIEDIYTAEGQQETIEALKPMITNDRLAIEPKGIDAVTLNVCCNFIINTNRKDGLRKTKNDRRFAPFYTQQQTKEDLIRDGLSRDYFFNLYDWLNNKNGFAIVSELLHTFNIPEGELNPANRQMAPLTSSTEAAINDGLGLIEQEILEAIEQEQTGFKGGWISSVFLNQLLDKLNVSRRITHNRRHEILQSLDYDLHPGLKNGRVNNVIMPDGGRPKLYICKTNLTKYSKNPADITRAYIDAQLK